jgi:adenine deaminase
MGHLEKKIKAARGEGRANLLLKNANLINVFSGEIYPADVAIWPYMEIPSWVLATMRRRRR